MSGCLYYYCVFIGIPLLNANGVDPYQMLYSVMSDLGLHCLHMSLSWNTRYKLVKVKGFCHRFTKGDNIC